MEIIALFGMYYTCRYFTYATEGMFGDVSDQTDLEAQYLTAQVECTLSIRGGGAAPFELKFLIICVSLRTEPSPSSLCIGSMIMDHGSKLTQHTDKPTSTRLPRAVSTGRLCEDDTLTLGNDEHEASLNPPEMDKKTLCWENLYA